MSSSTEVVTALTGSGVLRGHDARLATALPTPELRDGSWTRFGSGAVLGDAVTEQALDGLAEATRRAARAQGYAVGWAEGRRAAAVAAAEQAAAALAADALEQQRRESEHRSRLEALTNAAAGFAAATAVAAQQLEDQALLLARELTALLVGHELRTSADPAGDVVRRVLAVLPDGVATTVRVHPDVAAAIPGTAVGRDVSVVADTSLEPCDAVVETATQVVDLGIAAALERVREALA